MLGISSSDEKLERAIGMGLDAGLNYRENPDWDRWVLEQTGGEGVDLVVEVGGAGTLPRSLKAIRTGGTVAQVGVLAEGAEPLPMPTILHKMARIQGIYVGSRRDFVEMNKAVWLGATAAGGRGVPLDPGAGGAEADGRGQPLWEAGALGGVRGQGLNSQAQK